MHIDFFACFHAISLERSRFTTVKECDYTEVDPIVCGGARGTCTDSALRTDQQQKRKKTNRSILGLVYHDKETANSIRLLAVSEPSEKINLRDRVCEWNARGPHLHNNIGSEQSAKVVIINFCIKLEM